MAVVPVLIVPVVPEIVVVVVVVVAAGVVVVVVVGAPPYPLPLLHALLLWGVGGWGGGGLITYRQSRTVASECP